MKNLIRFFILFLSLTESFAQKNDNVMVLGYRIAINGPIPTLDFSYGSPDTGAYFSPIDMFEGNASICDSNGIMMMYTNGISLVNRFQQIVPGSNFFNTDPYNSANNLTYYRIPQIAIIIPAPGQSDLYYIFHSGVYIYSGNVIHPGVLRYSKVDMSMNGGSGQMTLRNIALLTDTFSFSSLQAVKHANGRDWWIVIHQFQTNKFFSFLVTPSGIQPEIQSDTGPVIGSGSDGQSTFSPDGTRYAFADNDSNFLSLYYFDRCNGSFTYDTIIRKNVNANGFNFSGCSFSPDNHFLYASDLLNLYQYDVTASDIPSSEKLIATSDLFRDPYLPSYFNHHCTGPDGKIYLSTGNTCAHLHVINQPNLADTNCNFTPHSQKIINYGNTVPNFPNYRLRALGGSICDSLPTSIATSVLINREYKIYPNPASSHLKIESESNTLGIQELTITNMEGKLLLKSAFNLKSTIDVSAFPSGIYVLSIKNENSSYTSRFTIVNSF
ncbi:MAG: T9SS type A sorting domain-containing protein [Bacteroidia bacterium]|nr:T9SS type A sorting domain-containing protein [Bacteroidia bacterium]